MSASIQDMLHKFKGIFEDDAFFFAVLLVLVSLVSFGVGRYSVAIETSPYTESTVYVTQSAPPTSAAVQATEKQQYVGSKNGSKYHFLWCPGASQIKEENKVFFNSPQEAASRGYTPAANCEGL